METIKLPDGYNGDIVECYTEPLEICGNVAKLRVVASDYLIRFCDIKHLTTFLRQRTAGDNYDNQETENDPR